MHIRKFTPVDLHKLSLQDAQKIVQDDFSDPDYAFSLMQNGEVYTIENQAGVIACLGFIRYSESHIRVWALLSSNMKKYLSFIHWKINRWLNSSNFQRIDATVDCEFPQAIRWIELLGFTREGRMKKFTPEGRDVYLYARVQ